MNQNQKTNLEKTSNKDQKSGWQKWREGQKKNTRKHKNTNVIQNRDSKKVHNFWKIECSDYSNAVILPGLWRYHIKTQHGKITSFKSQYCVNGSSFILDSINKVYSPVVHSSTLRTILCLAVLFRCKLHGSDVSSAYVCIDVDSDTKPVYFSQPPGFVEKGNDFVTDVEGNLWIPPCWSKLVQSFGWVPVGFWLHLEWCWFLFVYDCWIKWNYVFDHYHGWLDLIFHLHKIAQALHGIHVWKIWSKILWYNWLVDWNVDQAKWALSSFFEPIWLCEVNLSKIQSLGLNSLQNPCWSKSKIMLW